MTVAPTQLILDIEALPEFRVACRVEGESQIYEFEAVDVLQARNLLMNEIPGATAVMALQLPRKENHV